MWLGFIRSITAGFNVRFSLLLLSVTGLVRTRRPVHRENWLILWQASEQCYDERHIQAMCSVIDDTHHPCVTCIFPTGAYTPLSTAAFVLHGFVQSTRL